MNSQQYWECQALQWNVLNFPNKKKWNIQTPHENKYACPSVPAICKIQKVFLSTILKYWGDKQNIVES